MSRRYVNQLGHQDVIDQVFVVGEKQLRPNRNGNLYLQMELSDRTGKIAARMWNASETIYKAFENGDYVRVGRHDAIVPGRRAIDRHPAHQGLAATRSMPTTSPPCGPSRSTSSCSAWARSSAA